jgi:hypothetical protein
MALKFKICKLCFQLKIFYLKELNFEVEKKIRENLEKEEERGHIN